MNRNLFALLMPPVAVIKHGCAGCTAAPIAVFWLTGIVSLFFGLAGGVRALDTASWPELVLGVVLWGIAAAWARLVMGGVGEDAQSGPNSPLNSRVVPALDEVDPFKQISDAR